LTLPVQITLNLNPKPAQFDSHFWVSQISAAEDEDEEPLADAEPPLLLTGHRDGRVRVWDTACQVPGLLATVPFDLGGAGSKLRAVSALEVRQAAFKVTFF
jgi:hypothetical protein